MLAYPFERWRTTRKEEPEFPQPQPLHRAALLWSNADENPDQVQGQEGVGARSAGRPNAGDLAPSTERQCIPH
jgi:hypothetical protein